MRTSLPKYIKIIPKLVKLLTMPYLIGFTSGHSYLTDYQIDKIKQILDSENNEDIVNEYEQRFAALIGKGVGISFAAGRMAFYSLIKALSIGNGDEVILTGFTCSVMPNAVLRAGATPVFSDIDENTFGSNAQAIEKKITTHTKLIVAQHSFGIPCNIGGVVEIARKYKIPVIEDCAITLDSSVDGTKVGNWGDAAIFSTDHTKPLNTLTGGFFYTKNKSIYEKVRELSMNLPHLEKAHQKRLFNQFLFERENFTPEHYPRSIIASHIRAAKRKLNLDSHNCTFLDADYTNKPSSTSSYPYPAKMPSFLAQLGLFELDRWPRERGKRKSLLGEYLNIAYRADFDKYLPKAYANRSLDIIPQRFVFTHPNSENIINKMERFIDINLIWFRQPIVCCPEGYESLGYKFGSCPTSEKVGLNIINWPCNIPDNWFPKMLDMFKKVIEEKYN